ncbi:MAG: hypothetical protein RJB38_2073 [Pseudomonadota bacterium]
MQSLFQALQELLVLSVDDSRYNDARNEPRIEAAAQALVKGAHGAARMHGKSPDQDPSVGIFTALLQDGSKRAFDAYRSGHKAYARTLFRNMASACIACHSRTAAGSQLKWDFSSGFAQGLPLFQQAELLAAGRSFEAASATLNQVLTDESLAKKNPQQWNRALRIALAIQIRVERSPKKARELLENAEKTAGIPQFTRLDIQDWIRSLRAWESDEKAGKTLASNEKALFSESQRLMKLAQASQRYPMDRAGDVAYLRATSVLHQQLQVAPQGEKSADALLSLGLSYQTLRDFDFWNLNEIYFEACIHRAPHTDTAEACYRRLEESVIVGYTGSAGTELPVTERSRLDDLRRMASAPSIGKKSPQ